MSSRPALRLPSLEDIEWARRRVTGAAIRTPLVRVPQFARESRWPEIYLKLENLQPIGSFKIRGAASALLGMSADDLRDGVCTASAGNMAQGVAWCALTAGSPCKVIIPDGAPAAKRDAITALGAELVPVPFADWWRVMETHEPLDVPGWFVHPVENVDVMAGNGTIALEILEDLPDVDAVIVPFGGGGLISGIGAGIRALKPGCQVIAAEVETAAPLRASLDAGKARAIDRIPSFVDGIGGSAVLPAMWPLVRQVVDDAVVVSLPDVEDAIRFLVRRARVVAEGAGAASLAVARTGRVDARRIVCLISGGNIDATTLANILQGSLS